RHRDQQHLAKVGGVEVQTGALNRLVHRRQHIALKRDDLKGPGVFYRYVGNTAQRSIGAVVRHHDAAQDAGVCLAGSFRPAMHDIQQCAGLVHIKDTQRHLVVTAQADGRQIHNAQLAIQHFI
nr:hypothetical protein [Tanacetum cinerariifolium]